MNMREQIAALTKQVTDLQAKIVQQALEYSSLRELGDGAIQDLKDIHMNKIAQLETEHKKIIESKDGSIKYSQEQRSKLEAELSALHDIIDVIPGAIERERPTQYGTTPVAAAVRLASVLASKF